MGLGTGTIKLSEVISEFGVGGTIPTNMRAYLACGSYSGWDGGVAQHENNASIPSSGTLRLSHFRSTSSIVVDKDFESDTYSSTAVTYTDIYTPYYETKSGLWTTDISSILGFAWDTSGGTKGSIDVVGKSTFNLDLTCTLNSVFDFVSSSYTSAPDTACLAFTGDHRATGWGNPWISASITIGASTTTLNRSASLVPNGTYNSTNNITYWLWSGLFNFDVSYSSYNFKARVRIV